MRRSCTVGDAAAVAGEVRALVPAAASVAAEVREIVESVREGGDAAALEWERRFGGGEGGGGGGHDATRAGPVRVPPPPPRAPPEALDPAVRAGPELAVANGSAVAAPGAARAALAVLAPGQC